MKRFVLVAAGTAVGVTAVVSYHVTAPSAGANLAVSHSHSASAGSTAHTSTAHASTTHTSTTSRSTTTTSGTASAVPRSAVGEAVSFQYGEVEVKVTEDAGRITNVSIVHFDIADSHSQSIDQYAVPRLRQEVIAAQSAHIDGISGASYTSQAYAQSVQSALDKLA